MCRSDLKGLQEGDPTLQSVREMARAGQNRFYIRKGIIHRKWNPPGREGPEFEVDQLVLPTKYRPLVMKMSHCILLAGHLGQDKTIRRILRQFYWPTLFKDVKTFCRQWEECQRSSTRKPLKAPLVPLPIIAEPFKRIAQWILWVHCRRVVVVNATF